jgi:hypothetical protein
VILYYMMDEILNQLGFTEEIIPPSENKFKLPIDYLDKTEIYTLRKNVYQDLELEKTEDLSQNPIMYDYLLQPQTEFSKQTISKWTTITTNTEFLKETQQVIQELDVYDPIKQPVGFTPEYTTIMNIWKSAREDPNFLEKYSFIEFPMFKYLNKMPSFLQTISLINMSSPILSLLMPLLIFIFPFIILKIQGIPITMTMYINTLKHIGRQHFIGQLITSIENMNLKNLIYMICLIGIFLYQIYNNYMSCVRFYNNIAKINKQLCELQHYLDYSIRRMDTFSVITKSKQHYTKFREELSYNTNCLKSLKQLIGPICDFQPSFSKLNDIGFLLRCYYELYSNNEYADALQYSFSFEGYLTNLLGIFENLKKGIVNNAEFYETDEPKTPLYIKDQYYPTLMNDDYVSNDADFAKNMIITGPNAAGKTTFLKTTVLNIIFTQQFGYGFYKTCKIKPYTHIHSYLNIPDTSARDSLFQAESRRCKEILNEIEETAELKTRHFGIFDELYSGTNPIEASKSAYSFLMYLSKFENVDFALTTHYIDICDHLAKNSEKIENWKMDATMDDAGAIEYQYSISKGLSKIQGAIKVLKDMEYPEEIIETFMNYDSITKKKRATGAKKK